MSFTPRNVSSAMFLCAMRAGHKVGEEGGTTNDMIQLAGLREVILPLAGPFSKESLFVDVTWSFNGFVYNFGCRTVHVVNLPQVLCIPSLLDFLSCDLYFFAWVACLSSIWYCYGIY